MSEEKVFESISGAHKYAENSSRKNQKPRHIIESFGKFFIRDNTKLSKFEKLHATYINGEKKVQ